MHALGLRKVTSGWLFQTPRPLTAAQINAARHLAAAAGVTIETKSGEVSLSEILDGPPPSESSSPSASWP